jgi:hypothetical protein
MVSMMKNKPVIVKITTFDGKIYITECNHLGLAQNLVAEWLKTVEETPIFNIEISIDPSYYE